MIVFTDLHYLKTYKQDWDNHFSDIKHYKKKKLLLLQANLKVRNDEILPTKKNDDFDYEIFDDEEKAKSWIKEKIPDKVRYCSKQALRN